MYRLIKKIIKSIVPIKLIFLAEPKFRYILYHFYRGTKYQCNICNKNLRNFILSEDGDKLCPYCGSLSRTRKLWNIINPDLLNEDICILDFSPSRSIYRVLRNRPHINYYSTDLSGDFLSDFQYDITNINVDAEKYDLIICYHILEHIDNDNKAIQELFRVLKKGGTCIIQTPFKEGDTYENPTIITEEERLKHFGQKDHVRIYSTDGLKGRLEKNGFRVIVKHFKDINENKFGFKTKEDVLFCSK